MSNGAGAFSRPGRLVLAVTVLLAAVLRLAGSTRELWLDEITEVRFHVRVPWTEVLTRFDGSANHHVLNAVLAKASVAVLGETPFALRLPSIACGALGVLAFGFLARLLFEEGLALAVTLAFAVDSFAIFYAQQSRGYSQHLLLAIGSTFALVLLRRGAGRRAEAALAAATAFDAYAHLTAAGVFAGQLGSLGVPGPGRARAARGLLLGAAGAALLYLPMLGQMAGSLPEVRGGYGFRLLSEGFFDLLRPHAAGLLVVAIAGGAGALSLLRRAPAEGAAVLGPVLATVAIPLALGLRVYPRFLLFLLPAGLIVAAEGVRLLTIRKAALAAPLLAAAALAGAAARLPAFYSHPFQPFHEALDSARREDPSRRVIGVGLAGHGLSFHDPSVAVVLTVADAEEALAAASGHAFVMTTFPGQLRRERPELLQWVEQRGSPWRTFRGTVGDGDVTVWRTP